MFQPQITHTGKEEAYIQPKEYTRTQKSNKWALSEKSIKLMFNIIKMQQKYKIPGNYF